MILNKDDAVVTQDGVQLGVARVVYHRDPTEVNPDLLLYGSYLEVENLDYGDNYFVPMDFVAAHDAGTHRLTLAVKFKQVLDRTWTRQPDFVAHGRAVVEHLIAP